MLAGHVEHGHRQFGQHLLQRVELRRLRQVREIAGVQHERRRLRFGLDLRDRGAQRRGDVGVCRLVEADVAVADLDEAQAAAARRAAPSGRDRSARAASPQHAAGHRPDGPGADPGHALQEMSSIERFRRHLFFTHVLRYRRRKSTPHTSSAPRCPVAATNEAAPNNAIRYAHSRAMAGRRPDRRHAQRTATTAPIVPSQRCHSRMDEASTPEADASRQPAIAATTANAAPARTLATATLRQRRLPVRVATASATDGENDERDWEVHEQGMEPREKCHLAYIDRRRRESIPETARTIEVKE